MILVLAQAKGDPAADPVAKALSGRLLARLLVGETEPRLELRHLTAVLVWSAQAAAGNLAAYQRLCRGVNRLILVRTDAAPVPDIPGADRVDWFEADGPFALLRAVNDADERISNPRSGKSNLVRVAASLFAGLGLLAPAGGAAANQATPITNVAVPMKRAEADTQAEYELTETTPEAEDTTGPLILDLDERRVATLDPDAVAAAMAQYQPPKDTMHTAVSPQTPRPLRLLPF